MSDNKDRNKKLPYATDKLRRERRAQNLAAVFGTYGPGAAAEKIANQDLYELWNRKGR